MYPPNIEFRRATTVETCGWIEGNPASSDAAGFQQVGNVLCSVMVCAASTAPYCKTNVFAGDANLNGFSLFLCASNTRTETIYRFTTTSSMSENLATLGSTSVFTASSTAPSTSTLTLSSEHAGDTAARNSPSASATDNKSFSGESPSSITTATVKTGNEDTSQASATSYTSISPDPAAAASVSPTSIVGVVLGGVGAYKVPFRASPKLEKARFRVPSA
ncbi:hypothetical protein E4U54_000677 [Claviceps lovelessii]|nr:hypothetical protein E4U54_000677 [Claviceps lovelessii]